MASAAQDADWNRNLQLMKFGADRADTAWQQGFTQQQYADSLEQQAFENQQAKDKQLAGYGQAMLNAGLTWRAAFAGIGAFCGLLLLCSAPALLRSAGTLQPVRAAEKSAAPLHVTSIMLLLGLCTLFNQCHQTLVNTWGTVYAQRSLAVSDSLAALAPSVLWAGIMLARFTASRVANARNTVHLILWGSVIGGAALSAAALLNLPVPAYLGLFAAGVFGGAVIPLAIARLCALYPAVSGRVTSIIFLTLVSPSLILPSLTGRMADAVGFRWVMVLSGVFLLISAVFAGLTRKSTKA